MLKKTMKPMKKILITNAMKSFSRMHVVSIMLCALALVSPVRASLVSEVFGRIVRAAPRLAKPAEKAAAREALEIAFKKYGDDALRLAEEGGYGLTKAAAKHGDDVWRLARLSPDAPRALAASVDEILPIARRFGDDAARIEMRVPGCAEPLASSLSKKSLAKVAGGASKHEIQHFAVLSKRLSPKEMEAAVKIWKAGGPKVLERLTPGRILAYGGAGAMLLAAYRSPSALAEFGTTALTGMLGPTVAVLSWVLVALVLYLIHPLLFWLYRRIRKVIRKTSGPQPPAAGAR